MSTQQTLGIVLGAAGLVGVGIGSYFGVRAISKNSDAEQHCPRSPLCDGTVGAARATNRVDPPGVEPGLPACHTSASCTRTSRQARVR